MVDSEPLRMMLWRWNALKRRLRSSTRKVELLTSVRRRELGYLADLDGVRGLAVLAVMWFHTWPYIGGYNYRGGFLGVDVFFVLSGYLITTLLLREFAARGRIHLRSFYAPTWASCPSGAVRNASLRRACRRLASSSVGRAPILGKHAVRAVICRKLGSGTADSRTAPIRGRWRSRDSTTSFGPRF